MPDHLHLIVESRDAAQERKHLIRTLAGLSRTLEQRGLWERTPDAENIPDVQHLRRVVRYVHLNPSRARLVSDPLSWPWSTHRGIVGAEIDPWVMPGELASALRRELSGFQQWFHAYVSGDPSVTPGGTRFPAPAAPVTVATLPLERVLSAALSATHWSDVALRRHVTIHLALEQGWDDSAKLAEAVGVTSRSIRRYRSRVTDLSAARLCLGDVRLCFDVEVARGLSRARQVRFSASRRAWPTRPCAAR